MIAMRNGQIFVYGLAPAFLGFAFASLGHAAHTFRKLKDAEIEARLVSTEVTGPTDTCVTGPTKPSIWESPAKADVCLRPRALPGDGKSEPNRREIWISGNKIEFPGTGLEGVLQAQLPFSS